MIRISVSIPRLGFHRISSTAIRQKSTWSKNRPKSTLAATVTDSVGYPQERAESSSAGRVSSKLNEDVQRLRHIRNVGVLAHVDAGKTTVTERMLALAGVVRRVGSVDDGDTVTDFLPAERERGITIQSAAISFDWGWHNNPSGDDYEANDSVQIQLIDTPGHVDFSVEVNRSVAVLDGAVLVVDAVAGVQAQTETVWKALTRSPSLINNHEALVAEEAQDPLPCLAVINKMDKDGCHFNNAVKSLRYKLPGANPIPMQMPIFETSSKDYFSTLGLGEDDSRRFVSLPILSNSEQQCHLGDDILTGDFVGVVDLLHMRAVVWPENANVDNVDECVPHIIPLLRPDTNEPIDETCPITQQALEGRREFFEALAEVDEEIEESYLAEDQPSNAEFRAALRRATLAHKAVPVMAAAALKGKGVEPVMDAIADLLPSPLDRLPPALTHVDKPAPQKHQSAPPFKPGKITLGHPLHPSLLALAFKVVHMKGRGGSGDGRVVFARIYSGKMKERDVIHAISAPSPGETEGQGVDSRVERVGSILKLAGGELENVDASSCKSGDVCALVGLKSVVTGDTLVLAPGKESKKSKKAKKNGNNTHGRVCLAGVASPKPVLTVRLEPETTDQESQLSEALRLLAIEDPSLDVEESGSATLLSGLGELHIEVTLDRLYREFGLRVIKGSPSVTYRETITDCAETPNGTLLNFDRTVGDRRLQAAVHLRLEPASNCSLSMDSTTNCRLVAEPFVTVGPAVREFLGLEDYDETTPEDILIHKCTMYKALVQGCQGALRRGPLGSYAMANIRCHVVEIDAEDGLMGLQSLPGALRAAADNAVSTTLSDNSSLCRVMEPTMSVEVTLPSEMVGAVCSDLTGRRGTIGDVFVGNHCDDDNNEPKSSASDVHSKALIRGEVPLVEIIGYASSLRSLTGGEGSFSAEYKGHTPC